MIILIINGPNLNLLGVRNPEQYGKESLTDIEKWIKKNAKPKIKKIIFFQSNHEGKIIDIIHELYRKIDGIIINPGALTHYSYSLRDAIESVQIPTVEIHLSNIMDRESFRKKSYFSDISIGVISGLGTYGYEIAMDYGIYYLEKNKWT